MEEHDWVHLACHAHQNVTDPTKSGFFLHGGRGWRSYRPAKRQQGTRSCRTKQSTLRRGC
ncbi:hypothetical protein AG1IA_10411 [Rhizoctonia solani AG-1 IA]|uniref:Uncharacterized protein n=1 Tax=Thanatephorus cucumeris (strain AG1-IA) TaxID=983506 RepID=L8WGN3_THACA|nr:hypothetical protein AG1IA_10411 [Rhizoctonia solani AG-1 IA]